MEVHHCTAFLFSPHLAFWTAKEVIFDNKKDMALKPNDFFVLDTLTPKKKKTKKHLPKKKFPTTLNNNKT